MRGRVRVSKGNRRHREEMPSSEEMLNQGLMVDHVSQSMVSSNVGGFHSLDAYPPPSWTNIPPLGFQQLRTLQSLSSVTGDTTSQLAETLTSLVLKHRSDAVAAGGMAEFGASSFQWPWAEVGRKRSSAEDHLSIAAVKMKKVKGRRKVREPRFCFKTMSDVDVLDDGYKWRKYGQKVVKNTQHPRSYYRCTQDNCRVKKRVERLAEDPRMVITSYEGRHVHSPSRDDLDSPQAGFHINFFW
ncbi:probable WRKY transcription factor 56 [Aristolochia californica]|uniref:probable WRKY transcription factor 56 n=1 Tax=Aristolochia californica TaxID=171875 RepID=UPI0035E31B58